MNSALVLIVLMLAVPLQLFLSHYINSIYGSTGTSAAESATFVEGSSTQQRGNEAPRSMESVRREALDRCEPLETGSNIFGGHRWVVNQMHAEQKHDLKNILFFCSSYQSDGICFH